VFKHLILAFFYLFAISFATPPEMFRGVAVGNGVWNLQEFANMSINDAEDYARMKADGFNAARFYLSYKFLENDAEPYVYKQGGWEFIDKNIKLAKENGIKLILNMHVPQGGFQSNGEGGALWDIEENQKRLIALWRQLQNAMQTNPQ